MFPLLPEQVMNTSHPFCVNHFQWAKTLGGCSSALHQAFEALLAVFAKPVGTDAFTPLGQVDPIPSYSSPQSPKRGLGSVVDTGGQTVVDLNLLKPFHFTRGMEEQTTHGLGHRSRVL